MSASLLSTKLYRPQPRANIVARTRLTDKLQDAMRRPGGFTLISAPAGFGKTSLLSEFIARSARPAAWLTLDESDNDPIRFWSYLLEACRTVEPHIGESALALLQIPAPLPEQAIPTLLINDIAGLHGALLLILDDYHVIQNQSIHGALGFLLDHMPAQLQLVVSTRIDPPWPLSHFRVRQQMTEVRAADLRFNADETGAFLNGIMQLGLSPEDIAALEARTEGWIASLQLAALSMEGRSDLSAFIRNFTGSHAYVAEYLVEEVLQRQPEDVRSFLLRTSILKRMNASLSEAVSGQADGRSRLRQLLQANLFLVALDDEGEWFRYHQLFADLLQARLRQDLPAEALAALHARAMDWYEQAGMLPEAIEHALAAPDHARAVQIVEKAALPMILQAHVRTVESWLQAIPTEQQHSPRLDMAFAWLYLLRALPEQAQPYLDRLALFFATGDAADPSLEGEWLALRSKASNMQSKPAESRMLAERALKILPAADVHVRSLLFLSLAEACEQLLDYEGAASTYEMVVREAQAGGNYVAEILGTSAHARMLLLLGRLHAARDVALQGIRRMETTGRSTPFSATLYGELAQIHYHWHALDKARQYLAHSIQASGVTGFSDSEIYHHITLSRIAQMAGDWKEAGAEMERAAAVAERVPPAIIREQIVSQQARVDLALGRSAKAEAALQAEGFSFTPHFQFPALPEGAQMNLPLALLYNSALRLVLQRARDGQTGDVPRAIALAGALLDEELRRSGYPAALETLLIRSQLRGTTGDEQGALEDVVHALELAEPEGFISPFVEEGPPARRALEALSQRKGAHAAFIGRLLACFPAQPAAALPRREQLIEPLTRRELEVLGRIAAGDSNQAIADRLVITLSAVKKHSGNIFRKLNVNSRTQALLRARELGLLSAGE